MSSADTFLQRATVYLEDARDRSQHPTARFDALDASRAALLDARRAQAPPQSLLPIYTGLLTTAIGDPSHTVRIAVPQVIEDLCLRDLKSFVPSATQLLMRALHDDHVLVAKRAVRALTTLFRKLIGFVVHAGVGDLFPEASLAIWLQMQARAMSFIQATDEGLRKAATKFAETVVLAFSYSGGGASPEHFTLEYLIKRGSDSALLDASKLEQEGVLCVKAVVQLVHEALDGALVTKKPDDTPPERGLPPASFMTAISVLSNLVRRRPKLLEFTLPPLLTTAASITGSRGRASRAFHALTHSQRGSVLMMLKLSLLALRGFSYTRDENWNNGIAMALNDLSTSEREQEALRKERASLFKIQPHPKVEPLVSVEPGRSPQLPNVSHERPDLPPSSLNPTLQNSASNVPHRPQPSSLAMMPGLRLLPDDAFAMTQALVRTMRPQEVVNFVMTRLLLNIPPEESVPGAAEAARHANKRSVPQSEDSSVTPTPTQKKHKRSRFGTKDGPEPVTQSAPVKKVTVRKTMPPVIPAKLSTDAIDRLTILCCRRILTREAEARASGAVPLRVQLLARILTWFVHKKNHIFSKFCDEACAYIVQNVTESMSLAQAWLHCLAVADGFSHLSEHINKQTNGHDDAHTTEATEGEKAQTHANSFDPNSESKNIEVMNGSNDNKMGIDMTENVSAGEEKTVKGSDESSKKQTPEALESTMMMESGEISEVLEEDDDDNETDIWNKTSYEQIFVKIFTLLKKKLGVSAELFGKFISESPIIPEAVMKLMSSMCTELASVKEGLQTICAVIAERPGKDRSKCLSLLFELACNEDVAVRGPTIRLLANKLFVEGEAEVRQLIEERTVQEVQKAIESVRKEPLREHLKILECMSLLTTALCGQKYELVRHLCEAFIKLPREGKEIVKKQAMDLAGHIGLEGTPLTDLIGGTLLATDEVHEVDGKKSDGAEELALAVLRSGVRKVGIVTPLVVQAAMRRYEMCGDMEFLLTVIGGLSREDALKHLEAIVEYAKETSTNSNQQSSNINDSTENTESIAMKERVVRKEVFKDVIGKLTSSKVNIRPADMLVELHKLQPTAAVGFAIHQCFEHKAVFKQEAVAQAVQQVLDMTVIPDMLMRTVILARLFYPEMEGYLTDTVMTGLIAKKVWTNAVLWDGFLRYCVDVKKSAVKLLLSLPVSQLQDALLKKEELRALFRDMNKSNPKNVRKISTKHRKVIMSVLKQSSTEK